MKLTPQDHKILTALLDHDTPITPYRVSRDTKIAQTQVQFRLDKLEEAGIIFKDNSLYYPHLALTDKDVIQSVVKNLSNIVRAVESRQPTSAEGLKAFIDYIVHKTDIVESNGNNTKNP